MGGCGGSGGGGGGGGGGLVKHFYGQPTSLWVPMPLLITTSKQKANWVVVEGDKPQTNRQAPTHWLKFSEEAVFESETRNAFSKQYTFLY